MFGSDKKCSSELPWQAVASESRVSISLILENIHNLEMNCHECFTKFRSSPVFNSEGTSFRSLQTSLLTFCLRYDTDQVKSLAIVNESVISGPALDISSLYIASILSLISYIHPIEVKLSYIILHFSIPDGISPFPFSPSCNSVTVSNIVESVQLSIGKHGLKSSGWSFSVLSILFINLPLLDVPLLWSLVQASACLLLLPRHTRTFGVSCNTRICCFLDWLKLYSLYDKLNETLFRGNPLLLMVK